MAFFCNRCDDPVIGDTVAEGYCTRCLFGIEERECHLCGDPIAVDGGEEFCDDCQETLDVDSDDDPVFDASDEEFLRGPSF